MLSYQMQMRKSPRRWGNHCGQHNKLAQALQKRSDSVPCLKGQTLSGREIHTEGLSIPKSGKASLVMKSENDNKGRATIYLLSCGFPYRPRPWLLLRADTLRRFEL